MQRLSNRSGSNIHGSAFSGADRCRFRLRGFSGEQPSAACKQRNSQGLRDDVHQMEITPAPQIVTGAAVHSKSRIWHERDQQNSERKFADLSEPDSLVS